VRITIFDYGAGNLHSLAKALAGPAADIRIEPDPARSVDTDVLVLPGVGAFTTAAERLSSGNGAMGAGGREVVSRRLRDGLPTIGICLGMQLLFDSSEEGEGRGLGIVPGRVARLRTNRVPQIGWNRIEESGDRLFQTAPLGVAYYANSFVCHPDDDGCVIAWSEHEGERFPAAIRAGNVIGVQFHPEKSSMAGVRFLRACLEASTR
jgi:glutamine amidotransferase